jgi:putative FmdB family regulatory protein
MPTYDYRCPNGHDFEHFFRKISDASAELACPVCGATAIRKVSGGAGLHFKGSGFYLTDYGKNAHRKSGPDSGPSDSKSDGGDSKSTSSPAASKSESAPAAKTDSAAPKSDAPKSGESKPSPKTKGGDNT